jgi:hypothetical protein
MAKEAYSYAEGHAMHTISLVFYPLFMRLLCRVGVAM